MQPEIHPEEYDLVILGCGESGKYLAWTLAKKGRKAVVIERKWIGGACPNMACLPSKNIIHSAKVANLFHRSEEFGISKDNTRINMAAVRERKRKMVQGLVDMHLDNFAKSGAELVMGSGRFIAPRTIEVSLNDGGTRIFRGENVVINTGTRAAVDPIPGLIEAKPLTHIEALELDVVPEHLVILGGGYIGLEMAQAFRRLGAQVTIVERNMRLVHREDPDVSEALKEICKSEGINLALGTQLTRVEGQSGDRVTVEGTCHGSSINLKGSHVLVTGGRKPNTEGLSLESAGVELTERGHIRVNGRLQTTAAGIWATGDCAGSPHFTHISFDDFRVVRDNILGVDRVTTGRLVPFCLFTDPELARVGLSETEAKEKGIAYRIAKIPMAAVLRTRTLSETTGFMKVLVAADADHILGFTMLGVGAGEVMAVVQLAIMGRLPFTVLREAVFTHPTMPEGLVGLFGNVPARHEL